jgi:hypothetical protein
MEERKSNTSDDGEFIDDGGIIDDERLLAITLDEGENIVETEAAKQKKFIQDMENASTGLDVYYLLKGLPLGGGKHCLSLSMNRSKVYLIITGNSNQYQQGAQSVQGLRPSLTGQ